MAKKYQNRGNHHHRHAKQPSHQRLGPCPDGVPENTMQAISAPYNFVPLSDQVHIPEWGQAVSHDWPFQDGLSGEIHYSLQSDSPLLVGGKQRKATDRQPGEVHPFQLRDGRYAIPGSSIKGMLRAVLEIAGFGRMRMVDDQRLSVRDLTSGAKHIYGSQMTGGDKVSGFKPKAKAGWLRFNNAHGTWELQRCEFARVEQNDLASYSHDSWWETTPRTSAKEKYERWLSKEKSLKISFTPGPMGPHPHSGEKNLAYRKAEHLGHGDTHGTLVFTGQPGERKPRKTGVKHLEFIFFSENQNWEEIEENISKDFIQIHAKSDEWNYLKKNTRIPVFYLSDEKNGIRSMGLAMMYRLAYKKTIHEAIANSSPRHLEDPGQGYDLADLLFGATSDNSEDALRARVSCETALLTNKGAQPQAQPITILNGPKPSYYPNYIVQHGDSRVGDNYATLMDEKVKVRGFKRYPARPDSNVATPPPNAKPNVQVQLHTLPAGVEFQGRLVFHNLKPAELGALLWVITLGGNSSLRHGLGMGKSFGFGQVYFSIDTQASQVIPNDPDRPPFALDEVQQETLRNQFVEHMEKAHPPWSNSPQIANLLAMADPTAADALPKGMRLEHMRLDGNNEFVQAKKDKLVLQDYAKATGWDMRLREQAQEKTNAAEEHQRQEAEEHQRQEAEKRKQAERDAKIADLPPDAATIFDVMDLQKDKDNGVFAENLLECLQKLDSPLSAKAFDLASQEIERRWRGILANPRATQGRLQKPKFKERPIQLAEQLLRMKAPS